jgi:DNA-binding response OmpR family regulator
MKCASYEELQERVAWLESELGLQRDAAVIEKLKQAMAGALAHPHRSRGQAAALVAALYAAKGRPVSALQIFEAVPAKDAVSDDDRRPNNISVWVVTARKALGRDAIENIHGKGYYLTEEGMAKVAAILGGARP